MTFEETNRDSLTGLHNVGEMTKDLNDCLENKQTGFLMLIGIDNIKGINSKYGRKYGSSVLKEVGHFLARIAGDDYKAYRMDGDKFAINVPNGTYEIVEELYQKLHDTSELKCTLSSGAAIYDGNEDEDVDIIYLHAENALDRAKKQGKHTQVFYSKAIYNRHMNLLELEEELKESVKNNFEGFFLNYQPQLNGESYEIYGAETLVRFESPTRGKIRPDEFIPILEQTHLIVHVGRWILANAIRQCKIWREHLPNMHVSVNVSSVQLEQEELADHILMLLESYDLPGEALILELTESIELQDYPYVNEMFRELKEKGVKLSIDDFGTGYSSLSYLQSIAVDEIKIDRSFVKNIEKNTYNYQLLKNMIELSHNNGIQVCCEGVEMAEELALIKNLHPDILQGYLFSTPCSVKEFGRRYIDKESEVYRDHRRQETYFRTLEKKENADEISNSLERFFYRAILADTLAYAEIDLDQRRMISMGGLWESYMSEEYSEQTYEEVMVAHKDLVIHPDDVKAYEVFVRGDFLKAISKKKNDTRRVQFRRLIDGEMCWVEMTGYLFHEEMTGKHYALLYIKDINVRKTKELERELAATRDPLTGVYNRATFENEVVQHVLSCKEEVAGTMILLDMDHFKQINDQYGHTEGDKVLKDLSDVLMTTFRRKDLVGRIGGDEFVIFLKNMKNEEIIDRRMAELRAKLTKVNNHNMTCSVGITFVNSEDFSYEEAIKRADMALYHSKKNGRDCASYYEKI